jgi:hypothetical protein
MIVFQFCMTDIVLTGLPFPHAQAAMTLDMPERKPLSCKCRRSKCLKQYWSAYDVLLAFDAASLLSQFICRSRYTLLAKPLTDAHTES